MTIRAAETTMYAITFFISVPLILNMLTRFILKVVTSWKR